MLLAQRQFRETLPRKEEFLEGRIVFGTFRIVQSYRLNQHFQGLHRTINLGTALECLPRPFQNVAGGLAGLDVDSGLDYG